MWQLSWSGALAGLCHSLPQHTTIKHTHTHIYPQRTFSYIFAIDHTPLNPYKVYQNTSPLGGETLLGVSYAATLVVVTVVPFQQSGPPPIVGVCPAKNLRNGPTNGAHMASTALQLRAVLSHSDHTSNSAAP